MIPSTKARIGPRRKKTSSGHNEPEALATDLPWLSVANASGSCCKKRVRIGESILANTHPLAWVGFVRIPRIARPGSQLTPAS